MQDRRIGLALPGLAVLYVLSVAISSALAPRWAEIAAQIQIGEGILTLALAAETVTLTPSLLLIAPRLARRWGARQVAVIGAVAYAGTAPLVGISRSALALAGAMAAAGIATALLDLGMTRLAASAERAARRTLLGYLDVAATLGGLIAAATGAWAAGLMAVPAYTLVVGVIGVALALGAWPVLPAASAAPDGSQTPDRPLAARARATLGILAAASLGMELAIMDWASLLLRDLGAPTHLWGWGTAAAAAGATAAFLGVGPLADRLGGAIVLRVAAVLALAGAATVTLTDSPQVAIAALAVAGLGAVPAHPLALSAAGRGTQRDLAIVMAIGYGGLMAVRAAVGAVATVVGVQAALGGITIVLCVVVAFLAPATRR